MHSEIYRNHTIVVFRNGHSLVHCGVHAPADTKGPIVAECESAEKARVWVDHSLMIARRATAHGLPRGHA